MEEAHSVGEGVLDEHSPGIAGDDVAGSRVCVIGEQDRGLVVAEIFDEELPERMLTRANLLLIDPRSTIFAIRDIEVYGAPGRCWQEINFGQQVW